MYVRTVHLVASDLEQDVFFSVNHGQLIRLTTLLTTVSEERSAQCNKIWNFIVLLMSPPLPFHNKSVNPEKLFQQLLQPAEGFT